MKFLIALILLFAGCGYKPDTTYDFTVRCSHCNKTNEIRCRANLIVLTASTTKCRNCERSLCDADDDVYLNGLDLSGVVNFTRNTK